MRKIGMESQGVTHEYYGLELACFHLTRERYFAAQARKIACHEQ